MATFKKTMKRSLLWYPTIYPSPIDVCIHLFAVIGNGYEWQDGELVDWDYLDGQMPTRMKYPEDGKPSLINRLLRWFRGDRYYPTGFDLRQDAERAHMKWVEKNIDAIVDAEPTMSYSGSRLGSGYYFTKGISVKYAAAFEFPNDIKPDWAEALYEFFNCWLVSLNSEYGAPKKDGDISWWPADVQEARKAIREARARLHPILNNGETYAEFVEKTDKLFAKLGFPREIDSLTKEE